MVKKGNPHKQVSRVAALILLVAIFFFGFGSSEVAAIARQSLAFLTRVDLDNDHTQWRAFTEVPTPGLPTPSSEISSVSSPSLDGDALRCAITGGYAYSNLHCYRNLDGSPNSNTFRMSLSFYYRPRSTFNNQGGSSIVQALEFTMSKWLGQSRHEWAVQWENVGNGAPKWRYWDPHHLDSNNQPDRWVDLNIPIPPELLELEGERWYTLKLEGDIVAGKVHYTRISIDKLNDGFEGWIYPLDITVEPAVEAGDKLAVAVQLDGNNWNGTGQLSPYEVLLDRVTLAHANGTSIDHFIGNILRGTFLLDLHTSAYHSYPRVDSGPVKITSTRGIPVLAAERLIYKVNGVNTSFSETMALPNRQLDSTYWLPWYNNVGLDTQLRFANVSNSTATVRVFIGGQQMQGSPFTLSAGASTRKSFPGIDRGPVKIVSTQNIVVAERIIYKVNGLQTSFSEMLALPNNQLNTTYWLPWYNNLGLDTQLRIANATSTAASVRIFIGGQEIPGSPFTLPPNASVRKSFVIDNGPVRVVSTQKIVAAARVIYKVNGVPTSFTEMMGLANSHLNTIYWLPWYNNTGDLDTQLRIANVGSGTATIRVYIGGVEMPGSPFTVAAGASMRKSFAGVNNGPVQIASTVPVVAAERVIYKVNGVPTSFTEMMGLANSQLDTIYWLPWYNNVGLDTQLRFAAP